MKLLKKRNHFVEYITSAHSKPAIFWILYILFNINDHVFKIKRAEKWLWNLIKYEIFYIGGACAHSGNCCRHLMIYDHGKAVSTKKAFEKKCKKQNTFSRFIPQYNNNGNINSFMCKCLTQENHCNDYENRPTLCHNYPMSHFMLFDHILDGCGYKICRKSYQPSIKNKRLLAYISNVG